MGKRYRLIRKYFIKAASYDLDKNALIERSKVIIEFLETSSSRDDKITKGFLNRMDSYLDRSDSAVDPNENELMLELARESLDAAFESAGIKDSGYAEKSMEGSRLNGVGKIKNVNKYTAIAMSSYNFSPMIIPGNYVIKFKVDGQDYVLGSDQESYFNITKSRPVRSSEMTKAVSVNDLGQTLKVPFFWAATALADKSMFETGQMAGLNVPKINIYDTSILNITDPYIFLKGSKYLPKMRDLRYTLRRLHSLEREVISGKSGIMPFDQAEGVVSGYGKPMPDVVRKSELFLEIMYSPDREVRYSNGQIEGLRIKSINIVDDTVVEDYELNTEGLTNLINSGDLRIYKLNKINSSKTDMSEAR